MSVPVIRKVLKGQDSKIPKQSQKNLLVVPKLFLLGRPNSDIVTLLCQTIPINTIQPPGVVIGAKSGI